MPGTLAFTGQVHEQVIGPVKGQPELTLPSVDSDRHDQSVSKCCSLGLLYFIRNPMTSQNQEGLLLGGMIILQMRNLKPRGSVLGTTSSRLFISFTVSSKSNVLKAFSCKCHKK